MRRLIIAVLALLVLAGAADAKILVIVGDTPAALVNADGKYVINVWSRWQKILGLEYDTYAANYRKIVGTDTTDILDVANSGRYTMAICLNLPVLSSTTFDDSSGTDIVANNWGIGECHLANWVKRSSAYKFPIPLFLPLVGPMRNGNAWHTIKTGQLNTVGRTWTTTNFRSLTDAQGDSIYTAIQPTNITESFAVGQDSLSFVRLLIWRDDETTWDELDAKPTYLWMTVGSGNHKVVYLPYANQHPQAFMWPTVIAMFEKIVPIDMPIIAENFGSSNATFWGTSQDTVSLGVNFKAIKDYAVANGMKIDLLGLTHSMKNETGADAHAVFQTTAYSYQNAHPNNIRITPNTYNGWGTSQREWLGTTDATTYDGVDGVLARVAAAQAGILANFPTISLTRAYVYSGYFGAATTYTKQDSILTALAAKGIADVYNLGTGSYASAPPGDLTHSIVGAQRTWIGRGISAKELRFHPFSSFWRYQLNPDQVTNRDDSLRIAYINTASYQDNRGNFMRYLIPTMCGYYRTTGSQAVGSQGISVLTAATTHLSTHGAGYQPGMHLNALTFTGGSFTGATSTRSLFLDMMKQINGMVKMSNYVVDTYGVVKQPVFVYSWMEDCKYDRRHGAAYPNSHVSKE